MHLARALAQEAPLLLLDEPIAGLDIAHQLAAMDLLRATVDGGRAVAGGAARSGAGGAPLRSRSCCSPGGALRADARPADVLTPETLARVFGVRADVRLDAERPPDRRRHRTVARPS